MVRDNIVPVEVFGVDHIALLLYVDEVTSAMGRLDRDCLRCNPRTHHMLMGEKQNAMSMDWKPEWGTKLGGYRWRKDPSLLLPDHDDWDCLMDLESAGLAEILDLASGEARLTLKGIKVAREILRLKSLGVRPEDIPIKSIAL